MLFQKERKLRKKLERNKLSKKLLSAIGLTFTSLSQKFRLETLVNAEP